MDRRPDLTPEQRRKNRRLGIGLAIVVVLIMIWAFVRGGSLGGGGV